VGMGEMRKLLGGRGLVGSPRRHDDRLYFSDCSAGEVVAVGLDGCVEVVARVASLPLLAAADDSLRHVADDITFPNGMAVTVDNSTLIVADSYRHSLVAFDISAHGGLSNRRSGPSRAMVCPTASASTYRMPSGTPTCPTSSGCASPRAQVLQTVALDRGGFACVLGGPDRTTLFITAAHHRRQVAGHDRARDGDSGSGQVLTIQVDVPDDGWP
jgi:sugar lactone lactonase YvrE